MVLSSFLAANSSLTVSKPRTGNTTGMPQRAVQVQENSAALLFRLSMLLQKFEGCPSWRVRARLGALCPPGPRCVCVLLRHKPVLGQ